MNKEQYAAYRLTPEWRARRDACLERYEYRCQICGCSPIRRVIDAHHLHYNNVGNELPEDLLPLCAVHHELIHEQEDGYGSDVVSRLRKECGENFWSDPLPTHQTGLFDNTPVCAQCLTPCAPSDDAACPFCGATQRKRLHERELDDSPASAWSSLSGIARIRYGDRVSQKSLIRPELSYRIFSYEEWVAFPKEHFNSVIRSWCRHHGFVQYVGIGEAIPAKLPYRLVGKQIEVAEDFLAMVDRRSNYPRRSRGTQAS